MLYYFGCLRRTVGIAIGYAAVMTFLIASVLKPVMGLRVKEDAEDSGLDISLHGESGYSGPDALTAAAALD